MLRVADPRVLFAIAFREKRARDFLRYVCATKRRERIFIFLVPEHGNIGDQAIVLAEKEFFKKYLPQFQVLEVPESLDRPVAARLKAVHNDNFVITVPGGGFLGNLWLPSNYIQRVFLENFPNRKIVLFPNTVFFEEKGAWRKEIAEMRTTWREHKDLHIFIRDKSIDFLREKIIAENTFGVPDIVLSLDRSEPKFERAGVLLFFARTKKKRCRTRRFSRSKKICVPAAKAFRARTRSFPTAFPPMRASLKSNGNSTNFAARAS